MTNQVSRFNCHDLFRIVCKTMSETRVIQIVAAKGTGIPQKLKTYRSINVQSHPNGRGQGKVIRVALPSNTLFQKSSSQPTLEQSFRSDEDVGDVPLSKNAILSRENRRKKKQYVTSLESNLSAAKEDNEALKSQLKEQNETIGRLEQEVDHLKSVLANVDEISGLIKTIRRSNPLPVSSSFDCLAKKVKLDCLSESSGDCSSLHDDADFDVSDWLPSTIQDPPAKKMKLDRLDESSGDCGSLLDDADFDLSNWLPSTIQDPIWEALHSSELPLLDPSLSLGFN